jgi:protein gp37
MGATTTIEWTDATWNPVTGCTKISAGCDNCYAQRFSERFRGVAGHPFENGFDLQLRPERVGQPLFWRQPKMIFVNSMSDLFHKEIPLAFIDRVFDTMEQAHWHTFQVLTKRSSRLRDYVNRRYPGNAAPEHIWLGASIEDGTKKSRARHMQETNATIRFLSIEPLLGPIGELNLNGIQWVTLLQSVARRSIPRQAVRFSPSTQLLLPDETNKQNSLLLQRPRTFRPRRR